MNNLSFKKLIFFNQENALKRTFSHFGKKTKKNIRQDLKFKKKIRMQFETETKEKRFHKINMKYANILRLIEISYKKGDTFVTKNENNRNKMKREGI